MTPCTDVHETFTFCSIINIIDFLHNIFKQYYIQSNAVSQCILWKNWCFLFIGIICKFKVDLKVASITARWLNTVCFFAVAIGILKDKEPGSFIIRDSHSFRGAYGLAMKVATPPPSVLQQSKKSKRMLHISFYEIISWTMTQLAGQTHNLLINYTSFKTILYVP